MILRHVITGWVILFTTHTSVAQEFAGEESWKELFEYEGVRFLYIFYPKADSINDGVVMMLQNRNEYGISYRFTIIFESLEGKASANVEGSMKPLEFKTGDVAGLFWVPFDDGRPLGAIRMKNYRITRMESDTVPAECDTVCL